MTILRLQTSHQHIRSCLKIFQEMPHVLSVDRITGEDCFILKVAAPSPTALEPIVDSIGHFGTVRNSIVLRHEPDKPITMATLRAAAAAARMDGTLTDASAA